MCTLQDEASTLLLQDEASTLLLQDEASTIPHSRCLKSMPPVV